MAVNIHIPIIELNAQHTKGQNLFQELDAVIHLLLEFFSSGRRNTRLQGDWSSDVCSSDLTSCSTACRGSCSGWRRGPSRPGRWRPTQSRTTSCGREPGRPAGDEPGPNQGVSDDHVVEVDRKSVV